MFNSSGLVLIVRVLLSSLYAICPQIFGGLWFPVMAVSNGRAAWDGPVAGASSPQVAGASSQGARGVSALPWTLCSRPGLPSREKEGGAPQ